jgi:hypothetical protein
VQHRPLAAFDDEVSDLDRGFHGVLQCASINSSPDEVNGK